MGITIYYKSKAEIIETIDRLIEQLKDIPMALNKAGTKLLMKKLKENFILPGDMEQKWGQRPYLI